MSNPLRLLIVEDLDDHVELLLAHLRQGGFDPIHERVASASSMSAALERQKWDVVVADYSMPGFSAPAALAILRERNLDIPFILVSGSIGEDTAAAAMKAGVNDYIMKDKLTRLVPAIERELREAEVRRVRKQAEERIAHLAYHDPLTGLANRNLLVERMSATLSGSKPHCLALLLLELNRFRDIVNTLGHRHGDNLLVAVAERLRQAVGDAGLAAHLGAAKFAVLLPEANHRAALQLARHIRAALNAAYELDGFHLDLDPSLGIALAPEHGSRAGGLLRRAEVAQSLARSDEDGVAFYLPEHDLYSPRRLALIGELRHALEKDQLFLVYQPKIDLKTRQAEGVEALIRWQHPQYGVIPPDEFIPLAERAGLMGPVTRRVLDIALHRLRLLQQMEFDLTMAVNLSARNVQDPQLSEQVGTILKSAQVQPERLEMEITESHIMEDPKRARSNLLRMRAMGVQLSIDDFGTGYSSLGYLRELPVGTLKIDKSFVVGGLENPDDATIVRSTIELGHNLGLRVVAEGVEDQSTLDRLLTLGCDAAQGFFFAHPMRDAELNDWLVASRGKPAASLGGYHEGAAALP